MTASQTVRPPTSCPTATVPRSSTWLNDIHSQLNPTHVASVARPRNRGELTETIRHAKRNGQAVIPFGGRHAMGGQQFRTDAIAIDTTGLDRVLHLDPDTGVIEVEAGITWRGLLDWLDQGENRGKGSARPHGWAIAQKQTGADELTLGGSLSANVHGRGLCRPPIIDDVESFTLIDPEGRPVNCSRSENADLFRHAIGGYGLFGVIDSVRLRLAPRRKMERVVRSIGADTLEDAFAERIESGYEFGDFQFQIDDQSDDFLKRGIFSCYRPLPDDAEMAPAPALRRRDWLELLYLAHADKSRGFELYERHYHRTDRSRHWSDSHQFTVYLPDYHKEIDRRLGSPCPGSEMITELYVPRPSLPRFLERVAGTLRRENASLIYGTVRLIERDTESALPWAREPWACVIFNLCVEHSAVGLERAGVTFRALIDEALVEGGSFYLTYHRFARRDQVEAAHPGFRDFLRRKREWDPEQRFQSDWFAHCQSLFPRD